MEIADVRCVLCCRAYGSAKEDNPLCDVPGYESARMKLLRHVSFVDCPVSSFSLSDLVASIITSISSFYACKY